MTTTSPLLNSSLKMNYENNFSPIKFFFILIGAM
jgi:hypothetical protein